MQCDASQFLGYSHFFFAANRSRWFHFIRYWKSFLLDDFTVYPKDLWFKAFDLYQVLFKRKQYLSIQSAQQKKHACFSENYSLKLHPLIHTFTLDLSKKLKSHTNRKRLWFPYSFFYLAITHLQSYEHKGIQIEGVAISIIEFSNHL